jgi:sec-independent protein translocase protein TatA
MCGATRLRDLSPGRSALEERIMLGIGPAEMIVVGFVALLMFGKRLPEVMRSLGRSVTEFKKGISEIDDDFGRVETTINRAAARFPREGSSRNVGA